MMFTSNIADDMRIAIITVIGLIVVGISIWKRISRTRLEVAGDSVDRTRLVDAVADSRRAWTEAHTLRNELMVSNVKVARLEERCEALEGRNKLFYEERQNANARIAELEARVASLLSKKTWNPTASDTDGSRR